MSETPTVWKFHPKYVVNGFPKAGTHLIASMIDPICPEVPPEGLHTRPWAGTFHGNSWTTDWYPVEQSTYLLSRLRIATHLKAHLGHRPEIEKYLWLSGAAVVFIYRDFRDVAVSQLYHILHPDLYHPHKELYRELGSVEAGLRAVIQGIDRYPGIFERWQCYAPWLDVDWVFKVRFEDALANRAEVAGQILQYGLRRTTEIWNYDIAFDDEALKAAANAMVKASLDTDRSVTFRKGKVGDWREYFTPELKDLFKETDKDGWLIRLGYEENDNW